MRENLLIDIWCFIDLLDVSELAILNAIKQGRLPSVIDINKNHLIREQDFYKAFPDVPTFEQECSDPYDNMKNLSTTAIKNEQLKRRAQVLNALKRSLQNKNSQDK